MARSSLRAVFRSAIQEEASIRLKHRSALSINTFLGLLLLLAFVLTFGLGISLVRTKLLQNAHSMGMSLAQSYATEEETHIASFRNFMDLGIQYVEEISLRGGSPAEIQEWLHSYFSKLTVILGGNAIDPYAVVNGRIIAANPWEDDEGYDYRSTDWYQRALEADGELIFTDVYTDAITGEPVVTAARKFGQPDDVLAMDIYLRNFLLGSDELSVAEDCSFYLCDSTGTLIYASTGWSVTNETLQWYTDKLLEGIYDGSLSSYDASFVDPDGVVRGVYYHQMSNGWTVILTVPIQSVLMGDRNLTIYFLVGVGVLVFAILAAMVIRDLLQSKRIRLAGNTIEILSDSFYAIYRVNYREGTYAAIKISPDMVDRLPPSGDYDALLQAVRELVEPNTYHEFELCFSLESIRQRVAEHVADYGGDYQRRFGDTYKWVNIRTLYDARLAPDEVILCFREVDVEKRQELQHTIILQEALDTARKSTKAKSAFFSSMSHDMRTPLNAIIGLSELAQKNADDREKVDDYIRKIEFSGKHLLALINDILELSRLESGRNTLAHEQFDIRLCIEEIADIFRVQAAQENKRFTVQFDLRVSAVMGDAFKLGQILNNLLSNAFKYSEAGAQISLSVRQFDFQQHSKYQIIVEDTGIGMSEHFLTHLFEPYARETHFATRPTIGTGLGMPIVKSLVQQMSGEISVESELGKGSKFTVTLPLVAATAANSSAATTEPASEALSDLSGRRILLAEDNELNMEIATEILAMNGAEVIQARNGAEAVHLFEASAPHSFDAILMDMQMPEMDGCEAARTIRRLDRPDAAHVPIIAVTANAFAEDIAKTTEAGMNGHISKPIDFKVLLQTLSTLFVHRRGDDDPA